jgi:hypothetical protein
MGLADKKYDLSVTTPWILWSIILYVIALGLTLFLVVPTMRRAAEGLRGETSGAVASNGVVPSKYPAIAAGSGVASLLLVAVVVLMVWKP